VATTVRDNRIITLPTYGVLGYKIKWWNMLKNGRKVYPKESFYLKYMG
jgi:hypothetical protein